MDTGDFLTVINWTRNCVTGRIELRTPAFVERADNHTELLLMDKILVIYFDGYCSGQMSRVDYRGSNPWGMEILVRGTAAKRNSDISFC